MIYERVLLKKEIDARLDELVQEILAAYGKLDNVLILVVMNGAKHFAANLIEKIGDGVEVGYICATSYRGETQSSGNVIITSKTYSDLKGKRVMIVDDVYDTGLTLDTVVRFVSKQFPESIKTCVLLEKNKSHEIDVNIDFRGFLIEDSFLIGYGLDYKEKFRDLSFIASVNPKHILELNESELTTLPANHKNM